MSIIALPWLYIPYPDRGKPLYNGKIYIGQPDSVDPRDDTKTAVLVQEDGSTVEANYPISIGAGGVPTYSGSPVSIDVTGDYSILILDKDNRQIYYAANLGEVSEAILQSTLQAIAIMIGLPFADIGSILVTNTAGTSLNNARFLFDSTSGLLYALPLNIPAGSTVVSNSGSTLTTNNGDFDMWRYNLIAPNKIAVSQMVVAGGTGQPLPVNGVNENYAIGNEMADGWVVQTAVVNGTKDANGNVTADSGVVRYTIDKDEAGIIGLKQTFTSVLQHDGADLNQVYADEVGIITGEDATTQWIEINFGQPTGYFYVASISEQRGSPEVLSVAAITKLAS